MPHFMSSDGRSIAFSDSGGTAQTQLCLAGLTRDRRDFADLAAHLSDRYRIISMDYRGRGESDWATDPVAEYHPMVEGRDALELMAHLGLTEFGIIGTSRGGLIGMGLAAQLPAMIRTLVLNDVGPVLDPSGIAMIMSHLGRPLNYPDFSAAAHGLEAVFEDDFPGLSNARWLKFARTVFHEQDGRPVLSYDTKLRNSVQAAIDGPATDLWPIFDAVNCPMLLLRGENSTLLGRSTVEEMHLRKPALVSVEVKNRGHCPFLDEPEALDAIDAFLAAHQ
ncbi:MAG: alpha/beta hydrolase [Pseudomonadota bacterium]